MISPQTEGPTTGDKVHTEATGSRAAPVTLPFLASSDWPLGACPPWLTADVPGSLQGCPSRLLGRQSSGSCGGNGLNSWRNGW